MPFEREPRVIVTQDNCVLSYGAIDVTGASNYKPRHGVFMNDSGQVLIGPKLCREFFL